MKVKFFNQPYLLYYGDLTHVLHENYGFALMKFNIGFILRGNPPRLAMPQSVFLCSKVVCEIIEDA